MTLKKTGPFSQLFASAPPHTPFSAYQVEQNSLPLQVSDMCFWVQEMTAYIILRSGSHSLSREAERGQIWPLDSADFLLLKA